MAQTRSNFRAVKKDISLVNTRWLYTPYTKSKIKNTTVGTKSLVRYMKVGTSMFPVANVTLVTTQSSQEKTNLAELKKDWTQRAFPDLKWMIQEDANSLMMESYWPEVNRYINIQIQKIKTGQVSIVTMARVGYLKVIYRDLQDIRNGLIQSFAKEDPEVSQNVFFRKFKFLSLFIEKAFAQYGGISSLDLNNLLAGSNTNLSGIDLSGVAGVTTGNLGSSLTGSTTVTGLTTTSNINLNVTGGTTNTFTADPSMLQLSGDAVTATGNLNAASGNAVTVSNNAVTISNNAVTASNNAVTVSNNAVTATSNINAASANGVEISKNGVEASKHIENTAQIMNDLMRDKRNAAEMAAAAAAGAALGALAVGMVIGGIASGLGYIWNELLFDKTNKRIRWENFKQAREEIEKTENSAIALEKQLDSLALGLGNLNKLEKEAGGDLSYEDLLKDLETRRDENVIEAQTLRIMASKYSSNEEVKSCITRANNLEKEALQIEKALQFAKDNKINSLNKTNFFCEQIETYKRKLIASENSLAQLNTMLVAGKKEYFEYREQEIKQMEKNSEYINKQNSNGGFLESDKEVTDTAIDAASQLRSDNEDHFIKQCIKGDGDAGRYIHESYMKEVAKERTWGAELPYSEQTSKYFDCKKFYIFTQQERARQVGEPVDFDKIKKRAFDEAEKSSVISRNMHHGINVERIEMDLDENRKWFQKKEFENQCYQLLQQKMTESQLNSCNRVAPKLIALYRSHKKANDLWINNCQGAYETAISGANLDDPDFLKKALAEFKASH